MSARKLESAGLLGTPTRLETCLNLPANAVRIRKNGIEFLSHTAIPVMTEMTVGVEVLKERKKVQCTGVVVGCHGTKHLGYRVSMLFTGITAQAQARLEAIRPQPSA